jgi:hypothetical protein
MNSLIIGNGEIGSALHKIVGGDIKDKEYLQGKYDIIHICFPYNDAFISQVEMYQNQYNPKFTIIHSTVPIGTSKKLNAIHSPIRGIHPNLEEGIRIFVKFIGGDQASEVADYFRKYGIKVMLFGDSKTTEAMKLFDTLYYGICVEFAKEVNRFCFKNNLNFSDIYRLSNITYNDGYKELKHDEFVRPVLEPIMKTIGGHCVRQNAKLLKTDFANFIEDLNVKYDQR